METRYLKSLIAVVESGSIAEGARTEHITAAALGQRVQALERELGFALLSRSGHSAKPTQACMLLLPRARRMVREAELLQSDICEDGLSGNVRIGAISTALTGMLPRVLRQFTQLAPASNPVIVPGTSSGLFKMLQAGELDAALVVDPPFTLPRTLHTLVLRQEPLMLLAPQGTPDDHLALLLDQPYIRYDPNSWGGRYAAQWLEDQGIAPTVLCDLDALETIALLVADGMGVSLVPQWMGIERFASACRCMPIQGKGYTRSLVLVSPADSDCPQLLELLESVLSSARE